MNISTEDLAQLDNWVQDMSSVEDEEWCETPDRKFDVNFDMDEHGRRIAIAYPTIEDPETGMRTTDCTRWVIIALHK